MANEQHIYAGNGPPVTAPADYGHHYVDTTGGRVYLSVGSAVVGDWQLVPLTGLTYPIAAPNGTAGAPSYGFAADTDTGMYKTGDGNLSFSVNSINIISLSTATTTVTNDLSVTGNISAANYPPTGSNNNFSGFDSSGDLFSIPGWTFSATNYGYNIQNTIEPNNGGGNILNNSSVYVEPLQNSPNETWTVHYKNILLDNASSGFTFGTAGNAVTLLNHQITHKGTGNVGALSFISNFFDIGNGTDAISSTGLAYAFGFASILSGVTLTGPLQGYGFQPNFQAGSVLNSYANAFYDFATISGSVDSYNTLIASPTIGSITNNNNLVGVNCNPTVTTFTGNAQYIGMAVSGNLGTFGTGSYFGINMNSTVTSVQNAYGLYINMNNITASGTKRAIDVVGDVNIQGALSFTGGLSVGQINAYYSSALVDGGGVPTTVHSLISAPTVAANATVANADTIGVNTAMLFTAGANSTVTTAFLGLAALALPAVVSMDVGSTVDRFAGAVFAVSLDAGALGGTIDQAYGARALFLPNGVTTVNKLYGFEFALPFGDIATEQWGFYTPVDCFNWLKGSLKIDGTAGSTDKVTNSSVGLEIGGTTKALLTSRLTTTERDALTAINGMIIYNTTTAKFQGYEAGAWVDLV